MPFPSPSMSKIAITPNEWRIVAEILWQHVPERQVWVFGSRTTGKAKSYSDLDLAIGGDIPLSLCLMGSLHDAFDESMLPYKVDIVDLAAISPEFRQRIEGDFVLLQSAP